MPGYFAILPRHSLSHIDVSSITDKQMPNPANFAGRSHIVELVLAKKKINIQIIESYKRLPSES